MGITLPKLSKTARFGWNVAREAGASLLTYELYPLGMIGSSIPPVPTLWLKTKREKRPILFIHGIFHNRAAFAWLIQKLALWGWRHFQQINLLTSIHSIPSMAEQTARHVKELLQRHKARQVDIVAHSMGGIIARYFTQVLKGDKVVRNLVTLGTPHQGTKLSHYSFLPHLKELSPKSKLLRKLNSAPLPKSTQGLSVSGDLDLFIQPKQGACWPGARNIELEGVGHAGLLFSKRVAEIIASRLS